MELDVARQQEREVGDGAARDRALLAVADALEHAGGAQHVVGHALAPLTARLGTGERGAQRLRRAGELVGRAQRLAQSLHELAVLRGAVTLQRTDEIADPRQLVAHRRQPFADDVAVQRHLARARLGTHAELIAGDGDHAVDRGTHGRVTIRVALTSEIVSQPLQQPDDHDRHEGDHQHSHNQVPCHAGHHAEGV